MKRSLINSVVDVLAATSLLVRVVTDYLLRFPLPPASNSTHSLWGLSRQEWGTIHAWAGAGLLTVLLIHIVLHWDSIFTMVRCRSTSNQAASNQQQRIGFIATIALMAVAGLFAWAAEASVRELETPRHPTSRLQSPNVITPSSTAIPQYFQRDVWPQPEE